MPLIARKCCAYPRVVLGKRWRWLALNDRARSAISLTSQSSPQLIDFTAAACYRVIFKKKPYLWLTGIFLSKRKLYPWFATHPWLATNPPIPNLGAKVKINKTLPPTSPHSFLKKTHTYSSRHTDHLWFATNLPIPNLGVKVKINWALPPTFPIPF
jgi:hypothetical protein